MSLGVRCSSKCLQVERAQQMLAELEEEIAHPSPHMLRLGQLKRQKHLLDRMAAEVIDLTVREGDEDEERAQILECQTKLRAFASVAGLNARGTPKREAKSVAEPPLT